MMDLSFDLVRAEIAALQPVRAVGRIVALGQGTATVTGLSDIAALGDMVEIGSDPVQLAEIIQLSSDMVTILPDGGGEGLRLGMQVIHLGANEIAPHESWIGRVIDPIGRAVDGLPILRGPVARPVRGRPINPTERRGLGERLETGLAVFNTVLPMVRGQRIGLFAGSGVGKSTLMAKLARGLQADVVVIAMVGERGREVREFIERVLGPAGMKRSVIVAATSDQSPMMRRRCAWTAMTIAEHFRDRGRHVLFIADSITRFAEAHREVALASGENGNMRGYPPSTAHLITALCERAGPGTGDSGDITAVFSVLVAGSDMEEPIADILRGVLDGHVVLDRQIAERGRFPAIDLLRSVSRALPLAASDAENALITRARKLLGTYDRSEMMIQAGLYTKGSDPEIDAAITAWPRLDRFLTEDEPANIAASFTRLAGCVEG